MADPGFVAAWGAVTGTLSLLWAVGREVYERTDRWRERRRLAANLHIEMRELVDRRSGPVPKYGLVPTVVVSVVNLGREAAIVASIEARAPSQNDMVATPGRFEEPGVAAGVRKTMLPKRIEPGEIADFPSFALNVLDPNDVTIAAIDSDGRRVLVPQEQITQCREQWRHFEAASIEAAKKEPPASSA